MVSSVSDAMGWEGCARTRLIRLDGEIGNVASGVDGGTGGRCVPVTAR